MVNKYVFTIIKKVGIFTSYLPFLFIALFFIIPMLESVLQKEISNSLLAFLIILFNIIACFVLFWLFKNISKFTNSDIYRYFVILFCLILLFIITIKFYYIGDLLTFAILYLCAKISVKFKDLTDEKWFLYVTYNLYFMILMFFIKVFFYISAMDFILLLAFIFLILSYIAAWHNMKYLKIL